MMNEQDLDRIEYRHSDVPKLIKAIREYRVYCAGVQNQLLKLSRSKGLPLRAKAKLEAIIHDLYRVS